MHEGGADHVLLTRFNLPSPGYERSVRESLGWLEQRVGLFEKYCLPSVCAQTTPAFEWLVYFDPESPAWLRERITVWECSSPLTAVFRATVSPIELMGDLARLTGARGERLVTTNLDNDDALARNFVERIQTVPADSAPSAVYLTHGLIGAPPFVYRRTDKSNAFCSVSARWEDSVTCWLDWHNQLGRHMPVRREGGSPAWLQVVHGSNVSNRVHGAMVAPFKYQELFPALADGWTSPNASDRLRDAVVMRPARWGREAARRVVKEVVVAAAGRSALDRVRERMRGGRGRATPSKEA